MAEYVRAYRDCARYLARWCPPWAWIIGLADECRALRATVPTE